MPYPIGDSGGCLRFADLELPGLSRGCHPLVVDLCKEQFAPLIERYQWIPAAAGPDQRVRSSDLCLEFSCGYGLDVCFSTCDQGVLRCVSVLLG